MKSVIKRLLPLCLMVICFQAEGAEWNRFRGPNASGVASDKQLPIEYAPENAEWKVELKSNGNSSPIISEGLLYLTSAEFDNETKRGKRFLSAYATTDGKIRWSKSWPFSTYKTNKRNGFASASVCADKNGVYVFWQAENGSMLYGLDHSGEELWTYEVGRFGAGTGAATSPIVHQGVVLLSHDNEKYESFLLAVSAVDGKKKWQTVRKTQRTGYSTPVIYETNEGKTQVVFSHSYEGVVGVDFQNGEVQWQNVVFGDHAQRAVGSPIVAGNQVIAASGFTNGVRTLVSLAPDTLSDSHEALEMYRTTRNVPHCPTPLALNDQLYCWTDRGILSCLDLKTGEQVWLARVGGEYFTSPISLGDRILSIDRNGEIVVVGVGSKYVELGRSTLEEGVMATPALNEEAIFIRTDKTLLKFNLDEEK